MIHDAPAIHWCKLLPTSYNADITYLGLRQLYWIRKPFTEVEQIFIKVCDK